MMQQVATSGSSTWIGWKRRVSAGSFSIYWRYSAQVVAAMVRNVPRARGGLRRLAASPVPADPPAPIRVWASSMNRMIGVGELCTSSITERSLADARLAGEDRVILPPAHQDIDQLADLVIAAENRIHLAGSRLCGKILRKPIERCGALRGTGLLRSTRRSSQPRTIHRTQGFFLGARPDPAVFAGQDVGRHLVEFG